MPHNLKLLPEEKVQLIQRCLKGELAEGKRAKLRVWGPRQSANGLHNTKRMELKHFYPIDEIVSTVRS